MKREVHNLRPQVCIFGMVSNGIVLVVEVKGWDVVVEILLSSGGVWCEGW